MPGPSDISVENGQRHQAEMAALVQAFYPSVDAIGRITPVSHDDLPPVFRSLLAHDDHMTVTLEAHHDSLMSVQVQDEQSQEGVYARSSVLVRQTDASPVQFGIMRISLDGLPAVVRQQIEEHRAPLGRILIRNNLLREVELRALWRIEVGDVLREKLGFAAGAVTYGRSARILVEGSPAVELLEIAKADA